MLNLLGNTKTLCTGLSRRDLLQIGGLGTFGIGLQDVLGRTGHTTPGRVHGSKFGQAKSCILIYKYGSPPQHETFDPKPEAPVEVQGTFQAIPTNVPGVIIGEHLPKIATIMDRLTVVRSLSHPYPLHGTVYATTGIPDVDTKIEAQPRHKRQWPYLGSLVDYLEDQRHDGKRPDMPRNVAMPFPMGSKTELPPLAGPYGAMLGMRYDPVFTDFPYTGTGPSPEIGTNKIFNDPQQGIRPTERLQLSGAEADERTLARLGLRRSLLDQFDQARRALDHNERTSTYSLQQQMAFSLVTSGKMHTAIDYTREPSEVREAYGMTLFGQSCLAARRLIEAGTKFVTVFWDAYGLNAGSWDTHHNHFARLKDFLLPVFDQTFTALILDLEQRGLLDETLVLVLSEHGRTPEIDNKPRGAGRHHWSRAYSQVYAGGGMGRGQVIGRTDKSAGDVVENPISPKDILATALHLLGIDPERTFPDPEGRPMPLTGTGVFRPELLG
ncbi:DUF1501 domain-containing protein [Schlesneria paludicola]|uniref:DUF1501 domain-containing protein n=1 Tax=Schlesneria paludicola TaxID=360056 RepID=UPI00029A0525|nr:DUF1501 domain-containing protein [Schlesneria paludicola]